MRDHNEIAFEEANLTPDAVRVLEEARHYFRVDVEDCKFIKLPTGCLMCELPSDGDSTPQLHFLKSQWSEKIGSAST